MSILRLEKNPPPRFYRVFGLSLIVMGLLSGLALRPVVGLPVAGGLAAFLGFLALVPLAAPRTRAAHLTYLGVSIPAMLVGNIVGTLLVMLLFYGLILPLGLVLRLRRHPPLQLERNTETRWIVSKPSGEVESYQRQF